MQDDLPIRKDIDSKFNKRFSSKSTVRPDIFCFNLPSQYANALTQLAIEKNIGRAEALKDAVILYMKELHGFGQA